MTDESFKIVKTEYLSMSFSSIVGSAGGTLGLCVGFSVYTLLQSTVSVLRKCWIMTKLNRLWDVTIDEPGRLLNFMKHQRLWYILLLACAIIYSRSAYKEYRLGITNYSEKQEIISLKDIPTLHRGLSYLVGL